jgi:hypothetical protein
MDLTSHANRYREYPTEGRPRNSFSAAEPAPTLESSPTHAEHHNSLPAPSVRSLGS